MAKSGAKNELEKLIKDELDYGMPNLSDVNVSVQDELLPVTFVAMSPSFVKCENLDDEESVSCEQDPLLPAACKEYFCNSDMTKVKNVKKDKEYVPNLKIKLEAKEDLSFENTVSSKYSEDAFIVRTEEVEIKYESTIDIVEEKPIINSLYKETGDEDELLSFKGKSDILDCESKESTSISYKQQMNVEIGVANLNYLGMDAVMERFSTPNKVVESGHTNVAIDGTSKVKRKRNINELKKHFTEEQNSYICLHCEEVFISKLMYDQHLSSVSEKMDHVHPSEFTCQKELEECQRSSSSDMKNSFCNVPVSCSEQVEKLCETHTSQRSLSSSVCKNTSSKNKDLDTHLQTHEGEKLLNFCTAKQHFSCTVCEKSFSGQHYLNIHMQIHASKKCFSCGFCDRKFSLQSELDKHISNHATEKPFQCPICEKLFVYKGKLNIHMRIHTRERRFLCTVCGESFVYKYLQNRHMQIHVGEKRFLCSICERSFVHKAQLNRHMRFHP